MWPQMLYFSYMSLIKRNNQTENKFLLLFSIKHECTTGSINLLLSAMRGFHLEGVEYEHPPPHITPQCVWCVSVLMSVSNFWFPLSTSCILSPLYSPCNPRALVTLKGAVNPFLSAGQMKSNCI